MSAPEKDAKITIALAVGADIKTDTAISLAAQAKTLRCPIFIDRMSCAYVHHTRNMLMQRAIDRGSTHLMFIDSDVSFPLDGVQRLLAHDKDIIGATYNVRKPGPPISTVKLLDPEATGLDASLQKVRAVPTGFMLIRLSAITALELPSGGSEGDDPLPPLWFYFDYAGDEWMGEDVYFCELARRHGIEVWCDPTIPVGHIGEAVY